MLKHNSHKDYKIMTKGHPGVKVKNEKPLTPCKRQVKESRFHNERERESYTKVPSLSAAQDKNLRFHPINLAVPVAEYFRAVKNYKINLSQKIKNWRNINLGPFFFGPNINLGL